ncbi:hypothetical protein I4U23_015348 [Adineta vaga]|nr:hypothetical protein I4U23_015348 [Adineta vaga]
MPDKSCSLLIALGVLTLFGIITFALAAATLSTLVRRFNDLDKRFITTTASPIVTTSSSLPGFLNSALADTIHIEDLMSHLTQFENFARQNGNTRAIGTTGFAQTLDYIYELMQNKTYNQFKVVRETFSVQNFTIKGSPILSWSSNGVTANFVYSTSLPETAFTYVNYTAAINLSTYNLVQVKNNGCDDSDYDNVAGQAVLIKAGGICTYAEKGELAAKKNVSALLFYNHGLTISSLAPANFRLRQANLLPALSLSNAAGRTLLNAFSSSGSINVTLDIQREDYGRFDVQNICADTLNGKVNETIVLGSHSDSVPAGPGINDNGSGSAANLVLAMNLARLYGTTNYPKYPYRIRFCWWGGEEIGLVGAIHHVQQAENSSASSDFKLTNNLVNLNYDMLGSPNYIFGIYNGSSAKLGTPSKALPGSIRISEAFRDWFNQQNLPWDYTDFSGRSDYGPFLAAGIVAGGLFSGADETKSVAQRDAYESKLGLGRGGLAGATLDPCYHKACDTVKNIDQFGYLKMVQAAAYLLEFLGRKTDLTSWLYPDGRPAQNRLPQDYFPNSDYYM